MEAGFGSTRDSYLREHGVDTFFIIPPNHRRKVSSSEILMKNEFERQVELIVSITLYSNSLQPLLMNTLGVRSAIGSANRRKLSFRNVSNVVVQLLHTIKYSVPVPFSHLSAPNTNYLSPSQNSSVVGFNDANRKVCVFLLSFISK